MRLTKIYTKTGDSGKTLLSFGSQVSKDDRRIEAYGTVDELNAQTGLLADYLSQDLPSYDQRILSSLQRIQSHLFDIGGELSTLPERLDTTRQRVVSVDDVSVLESEIDSFNERLEPLANFVLPGGHFAVSLAHICRTVCRRAERRVVSLNNQEKIRKEVLVYLNRLSDWFFVVSRIIAKSVNAEEKLWK